MHLLAIQLRRLEGVVAVVMVFLEWELFRGRLRHPLLPLLYLQDLVLGWVQLKVITQASLQGCWAAGDPHRLELRT